MSIAHTESELTGRKPLCMIRIPANAVAFKELQCFKATILPHLTRVAYLNDQHHLLANEVEDLARNGDSIQNTRNIDALANLESQIKSELDLAIEKEPACLIQLEKYTDFMTNNHCDTRFTSPSKLIDTITIKDAQDLALCLEAAINNCNGPQCMENYRYCAYEVPSEGEVVIMGISLSS